MTLSVSYEYVKTVTKILTIDSSSFKVGVNLVMLKPNLFLRLRFTGSRVTLPFSTSATAACYSGTSSTAACYSHSSVGGC